MTATVTRPPGLFDDDHPPMVAMPVERVRLSFEAACEIECLALLVAKDIEASGDADCLAWRGIALRVAQLSAAVQFAAADERMSIRDLVRRVHGTVCSAWPKRLRDSGGEQ